ncbi:hypothetical protein GE061_019317 [Apolygus lucorum]|uniref:Uncharacterized protein n=1 Tax=Apolygus lucorum TaxID=248454 RepID=A0A8S9X7T1_APOLU|nr:hypothetical protein GE061_019317 [Apolygus lucorum]
MFTSATLSVFFFAIALTTLWVIHYNRIHETARSGLNSENKTRNGVELQFLWLSHQLWACKPVQDAGATHFFF